MAELTNSDWWTIAIAGYAAIVATGAVALEVRRWFEAGPRLKIDVMPSAQTINMPGTEHQTYLFATVANRGNAPTTITHFGLHDYGTWLNRLRSKPKWTAVVPHPEPLGAASVIPKTLQPGEIWSGMVEHDGRLKDAIRTGWLYVTIYASHENKPTLKRVHASAQPPEDAENI